MTRAQQRRLNEIIKAAIDGKPKMYNGLLLKLLDSLKEQGLVNFDLAVAGLSGKSYFRVAPWATLLGVKNSHYVPSETQLAAITKERSIFEEDDAQERARLARIAARKQA